MAELNDTSDVKNTVVKPAGSSGSSEGCSNIPIDEKKRRRMESNRESARRSRQKKQQHLDDLIKQVARLTRENQEFEKKIGEISRVFAGFEAQNKVLTSQKDKLAAELDSLESIIEVSKVVRGSPPSTATTTTTVANGGNYSDPMMKPWQLPCPSLPIMASSSTFRCFKF